MRHAYVVAVAATFTLATGAFAANERPNIVWIIVEDMSRHFGCYGEASVQTPHVDRLAAEGVRFSSAFVTAPVCSASRSALITGMYQTSINAHHHRSGDGKVKLQLPAPLQLVPKLFQDAGYYVTNGQYPWSTRPGKTDYNFAWDQSVYDGVDWAQRATGQPFFAQVQLRGGKLRDSKKWYADLEAALTADESAQTEDVRLPPYYPADPVIIEDWRQYLNTVQYTDREVGAVLDRLRDEGVLDDTYVFFLTDHGVSHARGKQFLYDEGIRVPLIIRGPGISAGAVRDDLVLQIDIAAASLALAGIDIPPWMQALDILADDYAPRPFIVSARDRCGEAVDRIRCVRTARYKYIRNFHPFRPYLVPNAYKDHKPIIRRLRALHAAGELNAAQAKIMASIRPAEELYDTQMDPHELRNLAGDPELTTECARLRQTLETWIRTTGDRGQLPEPQAAFESQMSHKLKALQARHPTTADEVRANVAKMRRWAAEGR